MDEDFLYYVRCRPVLCGCHCSLEIAGNISCSLEIGVIDNKELNLCELEEALHHKLRQKHKIIFGNIVKFKISLTV